MTFELTGGGGGSKGHNSDEICNFDVNNVDKKVILNTLVNNTEVTSTFGVGDKQLQELSDPYGVKSYNWCGNSNHNDSIYGESCMDMYITDCVDMYNMCSQAVHTVNNGVDDGVTLLNEQCINHPIFPYMETNTNKF